VEFSATKIRQRELGGGGIPWARGQRWCRDPCTTPSHPRTGLIFDHLPEIAPGCLRRLAVFSFCARRWGGQWSGLPVGENSGRDRSAWLPLVRLTAPLSALYA
jgi:hypothetical protein